LRVLGRVVQRFPQLSDGTIQPHLEIDEGLGCPEHAPQFVSGHDFTGTPDERLEDLERLIGKADSQAVPAEFT
jgi:hypothetical protein